MSTRLDAAILEVLGDSEHDHADSESTGDGDGQVTDLQVRTWLNEYVREIREALAVEVPALYNTTSAEQTLGATDTDLTIPDDLVRILRVERLTGRLWDPVPVWDGHAPDTNGLSWREEGGYVRLSDASGNTSGTYRIQYIYGPVDMERDEDLLEVPSALKPVVIQRACARLAVRCKEDPAPYQGEAERVWSTQMPRLRRRHMQPTPGFRYVAPTSLWRQR